MLCTSLALITPSLASIPFFGKANQHKGHSVKASSTMESYAVFSGYWIGTCDNDPELETSMTIKMDDDFSSIRIDDMDFPIDGFLTLGSQTNFDMDKGLIHLHWSKDGQQLLGAMMGYVKDDANLAKGNLEMYVGNSKMFYNGEKLELSYNFHTFNDGVFSTKESINCVYEKGYKTS